MKGPDPTKVLVEMLVDSTDEYLIVDLVSCSYSKLFEKSYNDARAPIAWTSDGVLVGAHIGDIDRSSQVEDVIRIDPTTGVRTELALPGPDRRCNGGWTSCGGVFLHP
jgi:hypothetical protein